MLELEALARNTSDNDTERSISVDERAELESYRYWIKKMANVCEAASQGDLEARLLHIDIDGDLERALRSVNGLLDYTDAFVRESKASLTAAANGKFFRKVLLKGMLGSFKQASEVINSAGEKMKRQTEEIERAASSTFALLRSEFD